jgi:hypothetical protein
MQLPTTPPHTSNHPYTFTCPQSVGAFVFLKWRPGCFCSCLPTYLYLSVKWNIRFLFVFEERMHLSASPMDVPCSDYPMALTCLLAPLFADPLVDVNLRHQVHHLKTYLSHLSPLCGGSFFIAGSNPCPAARTPLCNVSTSPIPTGNQVEFFRIPTCEVDPCQPS